MRISMDVHDQRAGGDRRGLPVSRAARFNATGFSRWVNGPGGRAFRLAAGTTCLALALAFRGHWWGIAAGVWSFFPLTAGGFDVCWISAALGGPFSGTAIRAEQAVPTP